jgi:DNA-binding transcriptional regulator PaaX
VLLPEDWPGVRAEELFWKLRDELAEPARDIADQTLDTVPARPSDSEAERS